MQRKLREEGEEELIKPKEKQQQNRVMLKYSERIQLPDLMRKQLKNHLLIIRRKKMIIRKWMIFSMKDFLKMPNSALFEFKTLLLLIVKNNYMFIKALSK